MSRSPRPTARRTSPQGEGTTRRAIVRLLKTEGATDSRRLARRLRLTPMAVRQHLYALQRERLVMAEERPVPLGRPAKYWQLTREADRLFPEAYAELVRAHTGGTAPAPAPTPTGQARTTSAAGAATDDGTD